ncbi:hypothetical protein GALMADRAFT_69980 [Galerina marginata CBS 339.88]|uniref:USP domain-containing protein n=1 Tax=Galerina marginata (strain CBS 339.88) TaxID=685588 RepID=A0A067T604_GALM3|nr:hypothetical protein GALMADRAFT_69980 [Galerina marginata CBS 339.88]
MPLGLIWDSHNYSCAYDSLFTILRHMWQSNSTYWTPILSDINSMTSSMVLGFQMQTSGLASFEMVRNDIRAALHRLDSQKFPYGPALISMEDLASRFLQTDQPISTKRRLCLNCNWTDINITQETYSLLIGINATNTTSLKDWFSSPNERTRYACNACSVRNVVLHLELNTIPPFIYVDLQGRTEIEISPKINIPNISGVETELFLEGIIYYGENHFTCRMFSDTSVWFHDGILTGSNAYRESPTELRSMLHRGTTTAIGVIYVQRQTV